MRTKGLGVGAVIGVMLTMGCGSVQSVDEELGERHDQLTGGDVAVDGQGEFVVALNGCSGALVSPYAIITAGHCFAEGVSDVRQSVRIGPGRRCATQHSAPAIGADECPTLTLRVHRHVDEDLALLTSDVPLSDARKGVGLPIDLAEPTSHVAVWGFGRGETVDARGNVQSVGAGERLLVAKRAISQNLLAGFETQAGSSAMCDGDSGGPATIRRDGGDILVGLLRASEASSENPQCTKPGGLEFWARAGAYLPWIEEVLGSCRRQLRSGRPVAVCNGKAKAEGDATDSPLYRLLNRPEVVEVDGTSRGAGRAGILPEDLEQETLTDATEAHEVLIDRKRVIRDFYETFGSNSAPARGAMPLKERALSQNDDRRFRVSGTQAPEVGRVIADVNFSSGEMGIARCSGTLIGSRIVRTAAHCLYVPDRGAAGYKKVTNLRFELERDGSSVTKIVNTSSWQAGAFVANNCYDVPTYQANLATCTSKDWAYLILPSNAWTSLGYTPAYMGYQTLGAGDLNRAAVHAGYPACTQGGVALPDAPQGCFDGSKWATNDTFECKIHQFTANYWKFRVGCDSSGGESGGPFYDGNTRALLGHAQWEVCTTCLGKTGLDFYAPLHVLGHDDYLIAKQNSLRSSYP